MNARQLDRAHIMDLLTELGAELDRRGLRGELFIVGGATLALAYNTRRATRDIDAVFEPKLVIYEEAGKIADRHGLPRSWLNDSVKGCARGRTSPPRRSPSFLGGVCGVTTANEILDLAERVIGPRRPLAAKVQYLLEELFPEP